MQTITISRDREVEVTADWCRIVEKKDGALKYGTLTTADEVDALLDEVGPYLVSMGHYGVGIFRGQTVSRFELDRFHQDLLLIQETMAVESVVANFDGEV